jgi:hypothetical protein
VLHPGHSRRLFSVNSTCHRMGSQVHPVCCSGLGGGGARLSTERILRAALSI